MKDKLKIVRASIVDVDTEIIVNAANKTLLGGGGVDGVIHRAAGPDLKKFCKTLGGCETGNAKLTPAFDLPYKGIIHAVGPVWKSGNNGEGELLKRAYEASLYLAAKHSFKSIAFPAISTGAYSFPLQEAIQIAVDTVWHSLLNYASIESVVFACIDRKTEAVFEDAISNIL